MTTTLNTPEEVVNYALKRIGHPFRVTNILDGSRASLAALDVYGQTRDALLTETDWDFAERVTVGNLLKQAPDSYVTNPWTPAYPALNWRFEYTFPTDALKIRGVRYQAVTIPNFDPRYCRFSIDNDSGYTPPAKVILTNVPNAIIIYTGQITDPNQWTASFLDAFADRLGKSIAPTLTGMEPTKLAAAEQQADEPTAVVTRT